MGKEQNPRRVAENEAMAKTKMLRTSPQKLNLVAAMIRGKKVDKALADLTFSKRRIAGDVKKCLQSAIANAENNHNLDVDSLVVAEAWVGKNLVLKRGRPRARGRFGKIMKPFSEITIKVREIDVAAAEAAKKAAATRRTTSNRQTEATTTPEAAAEELAEWDRRSTPSGCACRSTAPGTAAGSPTPRTMAICFLKT